MYLTHRFDTWILEQGFDSFEDMVNSKNTEELKALMREAVSDGWQHGRTSGVREAIEQLRKMYVLPHYIKDES